MACQRTSRAVMTARFSQPSRISALEPNGWAWVTANPPSPSMRMWSPRVSWLVSLTAGRRMGSWRAVMTPAPCPGRVRGDDPRGDDDVGGQRVVADDVDGHQMGPFLVADDPGFAGVAARADLGLVGVEVIGADPGAAQHVRAFPDLGRADPQDQREPAGAGVQPSLVADPLEAVPGDQAPGPPLEEPPRGRDGQRGRDEGREGDERPQGGDGRREPEVPASRAAVRVSSVRHRQAMPALERWKSTAQPSIR